MRQLIIFIAIVFTLSGPAQRVRGHPGAEGPRTRLESIHHHRITNAEGSPALLQGPDHTGQPRHRVPDLPRSQWLALSILHNGCLEGYHAGVRKGG